MSKNFHFDNPAKNMQTEQSSVTRKAFSTSEKFSLNDKVSYAEGSVISKIIIRNERGSITLFAFDKDEFLSEHTTPYDAIVQVLDGKGQVTIDGVNFDLSAGESIIMPANIRHAVYATERFKMLLSMIK
jgi:quercetin dioxygenase-like cupin family protein